MDVNALFDDANRGGRERRKVESEVLVDTHFLRSDSRIFFFFLEPNHLENKSPNVQ